MTADVEVIDCGGVLVRWICVGVAARESDDVSLVKVSACDVVMVTNAVAVTLNDVYVAIVNVVVTQTVSDVWILIWIDDVFVTNSFDHYNRKELNFALNKLNNKQKAKQMEH